MRVVRVVTSVLAWLVVTLVVLTALARPGGPLALARVALTQPTLSITGGIGGLRPGVPAVLVLDLHNAGEEDVVVRDVRARVDGASSTTCPVDALRITPWHGRLLVPAHGSATASLPVRLSASVRGCQGANWRLSYDAS